MPPEATLVSAQPTAPPGRCREELKHSVVALFQAGTAPEVRQRQRQRQGDPALDLDVPGMLPYPSDAAAAALAVALGVKEKFARKAVVDARLEGHFPGYPAGAHLYVMFHKPRGAVCTRHEANRFAGLRKTIYDTLPPGVPPLPHVGRLDNDTCGLLLLTDDGKLTERMLNKMHARRPNTPSGAHEGAAGDGGEGGEDDEGVEGVSKEYWVDVRPGRGVRFMHGGRIDVQEALRSMTAPLAYSRKGRAGATDCASVSTVASAPAAGGSDELGGGRETELCVSERPQRDGALPDLVRSAPGETSAGSNGSDASDVLQLKVVLCEGKNRQVRKLCARAGLVVERLHRVRFGPVALDDLAVGAARDLTPEEVAQCYAASSSGSSDVESCAVARPGAGVPGVIPVLGGRLCRDGGVISVAPSPPAPAKRGPADDAPVPCSGSKRPSRAGTVTEPPPKRVVTSDGFFGCTMV